MFDFIFTPAFWFGLFGAYMTLKKFVDDKRNTRVKKEADEARVERDELNAKFDNLSKRIAAAEKIDNEAYPAFIKMQATVDTLATTVHNHHENRLQGLATANERLGEKVGLEIKHTVSRVDGLEKRLDKIDEKLDKILMALSNRTVNVVQENK